MKYFSPEKLLVSVLFFKPFPKTEVYFLPFYYEVVSM